MHDTMTMAVPGWPIAKSGKYSAPPVQQAMNVAAISM